MGYKQILINRLIVFSLKDIYSQVLCFIPKKVTLKTNLTRKTAISNWHFSHDLYLKEQNNIENYLLLFLTPLIVGRFVQSCEER